MQKKRIKPLSSQNKIKKMSTKIINTTHEDMIVYFNLIN